MRTLTVLFLAFVIGLTAGAAEPWLKANDVVALVGGEDMVALAEEGWLETLVTWAQPQDHIRFRSLAWEGDTVFEQRRDLNYPTLEAQLDKMGATVVICQFGKMESFAGKDGVAAFTEAYEKLLARLNPEGKRRIALVDPANFSPPPEDASPHSLPDLTFRNADLDLYHDAIRRIAAKQDLLLLISEWPPRPGFFQTRDGIHLTPQAQVGIGYRLGVGLRVVSAEGNLLAEGDRTMTHRMSKMEDTIIAKNRLWFHYTRPQNWAFLAGNRTNQPSSRDHLEPTKRWFPEEMELWLPLIEAKEKEIWALASSPR